LAFVDLVAAMAQIVGKVVDQIRIALSPGAEWCDAHQLRANFGINRSYAYDLIDEGLIKSKNVRRRGMQRGRRLFNIASIRSFLDSLDDRKAEIWANTPEGLKHREEKRKQRENQIQQKEVMTT
jgi:hypothetical protein